MQQFRHLQLGSGFFRTTFHGDECFVCSKPNGGCRQWSVLAGPRGKHRSVSPRAWAGDDTHLLSAELLESELGLLHWPVHTLDQCHQQDVSDPTAVLGPAKAAAVGAPAPGWQMKSKYFQSSLPVLLYD